MDDPERPPRRWRWRHLAVAVAGAVAVAVAILVVTLGHSSKPGRQTPVPSASAAAHLPHGTRPLPASRLGAVKTFGVLGRVRRQDTEVSRRQALAGYDDIPGAIGRKGNHRRVLTALIRAAFIDRGHLGQGTFWVVSVWFHPPNIGVSPQHEWCVDHGLVDAATGRGAGHIDGCLPVGQHPQRVR
jgi:hypothetical protein